MEPEQVDTIYEYLENAQLFVALVPNVDQFIDALHRERVICNSHKFRVQQKADRRTQIEEIFKVLKEITDGWETTIQFLGNINCQSLADQMINYAEHKRQERMPTQDLLSSTTNTNIEQHVAAVSAELPLPASNRVVKKLKLTTANCKMHFDKLLKDPNLYQQLDISKWKVSPIIQSTAHLAFIGCTASKDTSRSQFDHAQLLKCQVNDDCFSCGFFENKFSSSEKRFVTRFLTSSIQEYFAALYCYLLMLAGYHDKRSEVVKSLLTEGCQLGRFLFGICSKELQFVAMIKWLQISFADVHDCNGSINKLISTLNYCLINCSNDDQALLGTHLLGTVSDIGESVGLQWKKCWTASRLKDFKNLSSSFSGFKGLKLFDIILEEDQRGYKFSSWGLHRWEPDVGPLVVLDYGPRSLAVSRLFEKINVLMCHLPDAKHIRSAMSHVPPVISLVLTAGCDVLVTISITYASHKHPVLKTFRLQYDNKFRRSFSQELNQQGVAVRLTVTEKQMGNWGSKESPKNCWFLKVTVDEDVFQGSLVESLIRLAINLNAK